MKQFIVLGLSVLLISGCMRQIQKTGKSTGLQIVEGLPVKLLAPSSFGQQIVLTQQAVITYKNNSHELLLVTELRQNSIVVVGFLPTGTRLFTIAYDGEQIDMQGYVQAVDNLPAEYLLMDMQLSIWPYEQLKQHYAQVSKAERIVLSESADKLTRALSVDNQSGIQIQYSVLPGYLGDIHYQHLQRDYNIQLQMLEYQELSE